MGSYTVFVTYELVLPALSMNSWKPIAVWQRTQLFRLGPDGVRVATACRELFHSAFLMWLFLLSWHWPQLPAPKSTSILGQLERFVLPKA